ncbi:hypothetical protein [Oceanidesulfovibrio marinus]|uniref:Uncharacterized protein n=1 Tax=Oceanidesulfovibrio marinus TaxID=370038 RepID=A0A6P1ZF00_9BACT|nr:hypothetical protein [Oceanidesulfovibrio marinus]TVM31209.1 hypothetical protein DQK91_19050 [Oceanidesulfovibrio marinus]
MHDDTTKFVDKILELAKPEERTLNGRLYMTKPVHLVKDPEPQTLSCHTLTALQDYLDANIDGLDLSDTLIHVASPVYVSIRQGLTLLTAQRPHLLNASPALPEQNNTVIDTPWLEPKDFIPYALTHFVTSNELDNLLKFISAMRCDNSGTVEDNGVTLKPYRTFYEVDQPESIFVVRVREGRGENKLPEIKLFQADGGKWANQAILNIVEWLKDHLPEEVTIIG